MNVLVDTHILLWMLLGSDRLSVSLKQRLLAADRLMVSVVSFWEISIKASGKGFTDLTLPEGWQGVFAEQCKVAGVELIGVEIADCSQLQQLPYHHRDPFDRMLIAQAKENHLAIATLDKAFSKYEVAIVC